MRHVPRRSAILVTLLAVLVSLVTPQGGRASYALTAPVPAVPYWSSVAGEAVRAKFPGEAAVLMAIAHAAIYDAAVAVAGGYRPYAIAPAVPANTSLDAAVAAAAYRTLVQLLPNSPIGLDTIYTQYLSTLPGDEATSNGIAVGDAVADGIMALRAGDGRDAVVGYTPLPFAPGVYEPTQSGTPLGTKLPGIRPLVLESASQFRPDGPSALTSQEYADDLKQLEDYGAKFSTLRTPEQTDLAFFWTAHDVPQWNRAMLRIASDRGLSQVQTARMLAMANITAGDAMIACFDAKYAFNFWRPIDAIHDADIDGNPLTEPDPTWQPLLRTPFHPEYPSAHGCHSRAIVEALAAFFGTDNVSFSIDSDAPNVQQRVRYYKRFKDAVREVLDARVWAGFHFRNSDEQGANLGRAIARYVIGKTFSN